MTATGHGAAVNRAIAAGQADLIRSFRELESHSPPLAEARPSARLARVLPALRQEALSPWVYLDYYRIGRHLREGGRVDLLPVDPARVAERIERPVPFGSVIAFGDPALASAGEWRALLELFGEGGDFPAALHPPDPCRHDRLAETITAARSLIRRVDPELAGLMDGLQAVLVLASTTPCARGTALGFGGATAFFFRGASLIDAHTRPALPRLVEVLVHEYTHAELFVLAQEGLLCTNDDGDRHRVRIRSDPRPMNGILHSLYVMGRLVEFFDRMDAVGVPWRSDGDAVLAAIRGRRAELVANGLSSLEAARRHGRLTSLGHTMLEASARRLGLDTPPP
ncbi:MAG: HEXXH motif-containing putative peptide modification protein [Synechococcaceae cyanobacterium]|nr:HEXXH motif-containing putative peptide modification protein [Synechococcaceae cyanobacterium]